jgi:hypothetical protein
VEALGAAKAFDRVVEVGDADDLAQALAHLPSTSEEEANTSTSGTAALQLEHPLLARARPRGPGRPQPRVVEG